MSNIGVLFSLIVCIFFAGISRIEAQSGGAKCPPLAPQSRLRLETYIDALFSAKMDVPSHTAHNHIVSDENLNQLCYKRLLVNNDSGQSSVYYLTPDERFLTVAMSDSAIDPLKARKESDRQREAALLSGVETQSGSARLTLVIFNDLQCPYCKRLHDWLQALPTDIRPHLRIVLKQFPLSMHSWAAQAAALEVCAAQQGEPQAKELEEFLLSHQETFQAQALLDQFANGVGETHLTNIPTLRECYQRGGADAVLARDRDLGDSLGVTGTPTAFLNGHKLADLSSAEQLTRTLRSALNQSTNDAFASDRSPSAVIRP